MPRLVKLRTFLAKRLRISNPEALQLLLDRRVQVNGENAGAAGTVNERDEIRVDGKILQAGKKFTYIKFYKPRGIESTMNKNIPANLATVFTHPEKLFPVGRLDKESEGLMIFTDDGEFYKHITRKDNGIEKEYLVTVDKPLTEEFLKAMRSGVMIMGKMTRPAIVQQESALEFRIILTEGMNRQIRRMCYKLGYEVMRLRRIRIGRAELSGLDEGRALEFSPVRWRIGHQKS